MGQFKDYEDLDEHPFTGLRKLSMPFKARIKNTEYIRKFFDGTPNFSQVEDVTIGKVYEIHAVNGYGMFQTLFSRMTWEMKIDWEVSFLKM